MLLSIANLTQKCWHASGGDCKKNGREDCFEARFPAVDFDSTYPAAGRGQIPVAGDCVRSAIRDICHIRIADYGIITLSPPPWKAH
jgi:hypothetical protein